MCCFKSLRSFSFILYNACLHDTQLIGLAQRLEELEGVRQQQEGTIIAKQEENTAASSQIKVNTQIFKYLAGHSLQEYVYRYTQGCS